MYKIQTLDKHDRMSTQDLLLAIGEALREGETDFEIAASGQHDIGGPLWQPEGKKLTFHVTNPGQRVGSMCLDGTEVIVDGSASADVGWLNAGGRIVVKGDAGDTAGHCAAGGTIYIGGRAGTRSGSLMKHDPLYDAPELWVLKNVGSFSFEFMGGGVAVVCGWDSGQFTSVLGDRSCIGMVGGTLYFRGEAEGLSPEVTVTALSEEDVQYLDRRMDDFLESVGKAGLREELSQWREWKKLRPLTFEERQNKPQASIRDFRTKEWVTGGIFSDVCTDDFAVHSTVTTGDYRLRTPAWENAKYAAPCEFNCPSSIPTQRRYNLLREGKTEAAYRLALEYTPFPGSVCGSVCPNPCMENCSRASIDQAVQIGELGYSSVYIQVEKPRVHTGKRISVIGGGVAGLSAAWQLVRLGHEVTVYDEFRLMGGKLEQAIPRSRLSHALLQQELRRIEEQGVNFVNGYKVDAGRFDKIRAESDAVIVATGGHIPRVFPWPGCEKAVKGLDFQKAVNRGENPKVGKRVIVIGAGNSGMDAALDAYEMGAETVTCIDVQKPAAFEKEISHFTSLGGKIIWPVMTKEITDEGIYADDGTLIPGDMVIVTVGETPDLNYLPQEKVKKFRDWLVPKADMSIMDGVFAAGDVTKPGRLTDAIGAGAKAARAANAFVLGFPFSEPAKEQIAKDRLNKEYFIKCHGCDLPDANQDFSRCISCGTCRDCKMCLESCPEKAIQRTENADGTFEFISDPARCIGCGICAGVCPSGIWAMRPNAEKIPMYRTYHKM